MTDLEKLVSQVNINLGYEKGIVRTTLQKTASLQDAIFDYGNQGYVIVDFEEDQGIYEISKCHPRESHFEDAFLPHDFRTKLISEAKEKILSLISTMTN